MYSPSPQRRNVILAMTLVMFILTVSYLHYVSSKTRALVVPSSLPPTRPPGTGIDALRKPVVQEETVVVPSPDDKERIALETECDKVDFHWLASERQFWDGWATVSMFLRTDGRFTRKNVDIKAGESVCVAVLLGPIPAVSSVNSESHGGPADSIVMTAVNGSIRVPITLQQHRKQSNAYFASVRFAYPGLYTLDASTEHRSYFWETPILHAYRPLHFLSNNKLHVTASGAPPETLPPCQARQPSHLDGSWLNRTGHFVFRPDLCQLGNHAPACLASTTVHVYGDANMRRNLKALASDRWCRTKRENCFCNDDMDDMTPYPWWNDATVPLTLEATNTKFYMNQLDTITLRDWRPEIGKRVRALPGANVVIVGVGNSDIQLSRMTPRQFAASFDDLLTHILVNYPTQTIVVRTPQYFGRGTLMSTSWNAGRSAAFATVIRERVALWKSDRVLLWDTHRLGLDDNSCAFAGTPYTRRHVVDTENQVLMSLLCEH